MAQTITLSNGKLCLVDDEDYVWLSRYHWFETNGYACRSCRIAACQRHNIAMHREILPIDPRTPIHHRDGNPLNNQRSNLVALTSREHSHEHREAIQSGVRRQKVRNKSGFKGVAWNARMGRFQVYFVIDGRNQFLGYYDDPEEAALVYDAAVLHYWGGEGYLNLLPHSR